MFGEWIMNYSELSDFEINKLVAEKLGRLVPVPQAFESEVIDDVLHYYDGNRSLFSCHLDYCDNPADAWPVIIDNSISTTSGKEWMAWSDTPVAWSDKTQISLFSYNINPLRAAMEVFLMMADAT